MAIKEERPNYRYSKAEKQHLKRWGNAVLVLLLIVVLGSIYAYLRYDGLGLDRILGTGSSGQQANGRTGAGAPQPAKYDFIEDLRAGSGSIFDDIERPQADDSIAEAPISDANNDEANNPDPVTPAPEWTPSAPVMDSLDGNAAVAQPPEPVARAAQPGDSALPEPYQANPIVSNPSVSTPAPITTPTPPVVAAPTQPAPVATATPAAPPPAVNTQPSPPVASSPPDTPKTLSAADLGTPLSEPAAPARPLVSSAPTTSQPASNAPATSAGQARFQVGSYSKPGNAERMRANLAYMGISSKIVNENGLYTVITDARSGSDRQQLEQKLKQQGINYFQRR